ncbi:TPA: hypothetical protein ACH3X1_001718 [Trebouxia sp. C0004]
MEHLEIAQFSLQISVAKLSTTGLLELLLEHTLPHSRKEQHGICTMDVCMSRNNVVTPLPVSCQLCTEKCVCQEGLQMADTKPCAVATATLYKACCEAYKPNC